MAVLIDAICSKCEKIQIDVWSNILDSKHSCGGKWERHWTFTDRVQPMCHESERCIVYISEKEGGKIQYPGRADVPVPGRLKRRGYERVELNVRDLASFERKHNVMNERRHFDRNGKGF